MIRLHSLKPQCNKFLDVLSWQCNGHRLRAHTPMCSRKQTSHEYEPSEFARTWEVVMEYKMKENIFCYGHTFPRHDTCPSWKSIKTRRIFKKGNFFTKTSTKSLVSNAKINAKPLENQEEEANHLHMHKDQDVRTKFSTNLQHGNRWFSTPNKKLNFSAIRHSVLPVVSLFTFGNFKIS